MIMRQFLVAVLTGAGLIIAVAPVASQGIVAPPPVVVTAPCPQGLILKGNNCVKVCPPNYKLVNKNCEKIQIHVNPPKCPSGNTLHSANELAACHPKPQTCPAGQWLKGHHCVKKN